jgi:hypothetical protein
MKADQCCSEPKFLVIDSYLTCVSCGCVIEHSIDTDYSHNLTFVKESPAPGIRTQTKKNEILDAHKVLISPDMQFFFRRVNKLFTEKDWESRMEMELGDWILHAKQIGYCIPKFIESEFNSLAKKIKAIRKKNLFAFGFNAVFLVILIHLYRKYRIARIDRKILAGQFEISYKILNKCFRLFCEEVLRKLGENFQNHESITDIIVFTINQQIPPDLYGYANKRAMEILTKITPHLPYQSKRPSTIACSVLCVALLHHPFERSNIVKHFHLTHNILSSTIHWISALI